MTWIGHCVDCGAVVQAAESYGPESAPLCVTCWDKARARLAAARAERRKVQGYGDYAILRGIVGKPNNGAGGKA